MTKAQLVKQVQEVHGNLSRQEALKAVNAVWDTIKQGLLQGRDIQVKGFGKFAVCSQAARVGRNMNTGQAVNISARRVVVFRPSNRLKELVNS
jgi:integration host factor subunit alpha